MPPTYSYIIEKDVITFTSPYNPIFIDEVKAIPGRKYKPETKQWYCQINIISASHDLPFFTFNILPEILLCANAAFPKISKAKDM